MVFWLAIVAASCAGLFSVQVCFYLFKGFVQRKAKEGQRILFLRGLPHQMKLTLAHFYAYKTHTLRFNRLDSATKVLIAKRVLYVSGYVNAFIPYVTINADYWGSIGAWAGKDPAFQEMAEQIGAEAGQGAAETARINAEAGQIDAETGQITAE